MPLLSAIKSRLKTKHPDQHPNKPHTIEEVYDAACYILQSSSRSAQINPVGCIPPITIQQRPLPVAASPEPTVKNKSIASLFQEFTKTIIEAINNKPSYRGPPKNAASRQTDCNFCGGGHYIRECHVVDEYIKAGKCRCNQEGKVVLPSGIYMSQEIPGTLLAERVDEWHKQFPNQLAVGTLLHNKLAHYHLRQSSTTNDQPRMFARRPQNWYSR